MRSDRLVGSLFAGVAALAVLTACGGSSGSSASGSSSAAKTTASTSTSSGAAAAGSSFCQQAQTFAAQAGQALAAGQSNPDLQQQLQALTAQLKSINPPPAIASDWQDFTAVLQQFAQAYQGTDLSDPAQVQQLQAKIAPLVGKLSADGQRLQQYLQTQCGITAGDTSSSTS